MTLHLRSTIFQWVKDNEHVKLVLRQHPMFLLESMLVPSIWLIGGLILAFLGNQMAVASLRIGRRKPDPAIFHQAARLINSPTSKCIYIGDRIARDIVGARKAGYGLAIQIINPFDHGEHDFGAIPDAVITTMDELIGILEKHLPANEHIETPRFEKKGTQAIQGAGSPPQSAAAAT